MSADQRESSTEHAAGSLEVGPRTLPPPDGASDALRDAVAASADVVGERLQALEHVPEDEAAWVALIDADNERKLAALEPMIEASPASVEHDRIGGVDVYHVVPDEIEPIHEDHLFVHVHGGAWVLNGGLACTAEAILIALGTKMRAVSIDYRRPPQHPAPAAVDDVVTVFRALRKERSARSMALGGSSAGGNLTLCAVQRLIETESSVPGALFVGTPGADLTKTGDSRFLNTGVDRSLSRWDGTVDAMARLYAGEMALDDPRVAPIYGSFDGFPPTLLASGTRDLMLSDTVRTHIKLREAGAEADLLVYEGSSHGDYLMEVGSPESRHFIAELDRFLTAHLRSSVRRAPERQDGMSAALDLGVN